MPGDLCPYGLAFKDPLKHQGYSVEDHHLRTREEAGSLKTEHGVDTTPQILIGGERIGGHDDLREHFGKEVRTQDETSYRPVIAIFSFAFLMAL